MSKVILFLRACALTLGLWVITFVFGSLAILTIPLSSRRRYALIMHPWCSCFLWLLKTVCGIRYRIQGFENLPEGPAILLSKHQSAWETIAYVALFPRQLCFVFKRELLLIPFFGWAIALMDMIHIDRSKGSAAFDDVIEQGRKMLDKGKWIIMFPEGTRTPVGGQGRYKSGGARLAIATQTPVVPIAMNSGERWPKHAFVKTPGLVTISIGKPLQVAGKIAHQLNDEVEAWIEGEMRNISPNAYLSPPKGTA